MKRLLIATAIAASLLAPSTASAASPFQTAFVAAIGTYEKICGAEAGPEDRARYREYIKVIDLKQFELALEDLKNDIEKLGGTAKWCNYIKTMTR